MSTKCPESAHIFILLGFFWYENKSEDRKQTLAQDRGRQNRTIELAISGQNLPVGTRGTDIQ